MHKCCAEIAEKVDNPATLYLGVGNKEGVCPTHGGFVK